MALYNVLRKFTSDVAHTAGDVVDLDGRNIQLLIDQRFIAPAEPGAVAKSASPKKGKAASQMKDSAVAPQE